MRHWTSLKEALQANPGFEFAFLGTPIYEPPGEEVDKRSLLVEMCRPGRSVDWKCLDLLLTYQTKRSKELWMEGHSLNFNRSASFVLVPKMVERWLQELAVGTSEKGEPKFGDLLFGYKILGSIDGSTPIFLISKPKHVAHVDFSQQTRRIH